MLLLVPTLAHARDSGIMMCAGVDHSDRERDFISMWFRVLDSRAADGHSRIETLSTHRGDLVYRGDAIGQANQIRIANGKRVLFEGRYEVDFPSATLHLVGKYDDTAYDEKHHLHDTDITLRCVDISI